MIAICKLVKGYRVDLVGWGSVAVEVGDKVDEVVLFECDHFVRQLWFDEIKAATFLEEGVVRLVIHQKESGFLHNLVEVVDVSIKLRVTDVLGEDHFSQSWASVCVQVDAQLGIVSSGGDVHFA